MLQSRYPRDLIGYGARPPHARWPGGARVALQFVLNYEEGGENCVLHGDAASEQFLSEIVGAAAYPDRHMSMEGIYEYGSRAGVWRLLREFEKRGLPLTIFGVSMALQRHPELTRAFVELGHEIACHGWRWIHYQNIDEATEREHMRIGMQIIKDLTGELPLGWYTGRDSPNTRRLVVEHGGFLLLSIGMHCRLLGRPGRFRALQRFLDYVQGHDKVWICRRVDIARHWAQVHPFQARDTAAAALPACRETAPA
uniref:polysaccharide deacetylase family protein n=1 Tax=Cupriavidus taiwanensis TaxID=164546 RepID=UPI000E2F3DB1|nr:polysaccharide deacetylase family protein [Cupriavidus taiwanensis]